MTITRRRSATLSLLRSWLPARGRPLEFGSSGGEARRPVGDGPARRRPASPASSPIGATRRRPTPAATQAAYDGLPGVLQQQDQPRRTRRTFLQHGAEFAQSLEQPGHRLVRAGTTATVSSVQPISHRRPRCRSRSGQLGTPLLPNRVRLRGARERHLEGRRPRRSAACSCCRATSPPACSDQRSTALAGATRRVARRGTP